MSTQTDPNAAYNDKVREIAEELISILYPESITDSYGLPYSKEKLKKQSDRKLQICLPAARAMVAKMAKEYEEGFFASLDDSIGLMNEDHPSYAYYNELCVEKMQERGLIPNTKTDKDAR